MGNEELQNEEEANVEEGNFIRLEDPSHRDKKACDGKGNKSWFSTLRRERVLLRDRAVEQMLWKRRVLC